MNNNWDFSLLVLRATLQKLDSAELKEYWPAESEVDDGGDHSVGGDLEILAVEDEALAAVGGFRNENVAPVEIAVLELQRRFRNWK